jgi:predicted enzyme related to lactoylglutathione lyase
MEPRTAYPAGVPCWLNVLQPDPERTMAFYRDLFGWTYEVRTPADAPVTYAYARLDGQTVGAVGGPPQDGEPTGWSTYIAVASADETADLAAANGAKVVSGPEAVGPSGRVAELVDPHGARIGIWEAGELAGAELVNAPGSWNFSELHSPDPDASAAFYAAVFGWECDRFEIGPDQVTWLFRMPGYGDFLAQSDPEIRERQAAEQAPGGFEDAVAWMVPLEDGSGDARWTVTLAVADADAAHDRAIELGATEVTPLFDTAYTRASEVRDPQGATLTLSEYRPPTD